MSASMNDAQRKKSYPLCTVSIFKPLLTSATNNFSSSSSSITWTRISIHLTQALLFFAPQDGKPWQREKTSLASILLCLRRKPSSITLTKTAQQRDDQIPSALTSIQGVLSEMDERVQASEAQHCSSTSFLINYHCITVT